MLNKYRFGFEPAGLVLFIVVMIPTFIWLAVPAPDDILRKVSETPVTDTIGSVCQWIFIAAACVLINKDSQKLRLTPLIVLSAVCVILYFSGWVLYYIGVTEPYVIMLMTLPPCLSFIFFSLERKNYPALVPAVGFMICHLIYGIVNYIV